MVITVRPAVPDDGTAMGGIWVAAWRWAYADVMNADFLAGLDPVALGERWAEGIRNPPEAHAGAAVLVGEVDDEVVAMASVGNFRRPADEESTDPEPTGELWMLNAHPDAFGTGVATAVHTEALRLLASDGHRLAALWVVEQNPRARRFYEREGWSDDGIRRTETVGGSDVIEARYCLNLAD